MHFWKYWRRGAAVPLALLVAALVACATAPRPRQLGQYATLSPRLAVVDSERPPVNLTVDLAAPASVVVIYVAPGRSTRIVYPADSGAIPRLAAGSRRIVAQWPRAVMELARRDSIARAAGANRTRRETNERRPVVALPDPEAGIAPEGYLMLFATPRDLSYDDVRRKVEGVTTPLGTDEALNAIAKQVTSTLESDAPWAAYAVDVVVAPDEERLPARGGRSPR